MLKKALVGSNLGPAAGASGNSRKALETGNYELRERQKK